MFDAAIAAAQPAECLPRYLPQNPSGRVIVIGAGKASAQMAQVLEQHQPDVTGLVVTRYGYAAPCRRIEIVEAAHPVPDPAGLNAARRMLAQVSNLTADDLVICLISGGGSALLPLPPPGLNLADKQAINRALLRCGAGINDMNCVRRHLSAIKGGRLAAACHPAQVLTLAISDVPGDNPVNIASGPTVGDPTTCADALDIIRRYHLPMPPAALEWLESGQGESVKPDDPRLAGNRFELITTPRLALQASAKIARAQGIATHILSDRIEGEARDVGKTLAGLALEVARHNTPFSAPCVLLSGGETTVTLKGQGRGGRNVEFLLSLGIALEGAARIHALAGDTDGVDGMADIAGAQLTPDTLARAWRQGVNPHQALADNDGHGFFEALGDAVITGPTQTNVNDFRAILIQR